MRIRSLKPEWLQDEKISALGDSARVLSVGLVLLADDQGRGRANPAFLAAQVWTYQAPRLAKVSEALKKLSEIGFVVLYNVHGQQYYQIRNWAKHQKVTHPAKPRLPGVEEAESGDSPEALAETPETLAQVPETLVPDLRSPITDHRSASVTPLPQPKKRSDEECQSLAEYLHAAIVRNTPDARLPQSLAKWSDSFRLMRDLDHRAPEDIRAVVDWATANTFWRPNILSAEKLREKFDTLKGHMQRETPPQKSGKEEFVC